MGIYAIVSGGYRGYASDQDERNAIKMDLWLPHTIDFCATVERVPGHFLAEVRTVDEFVRYLGSPDIAKSKNIVVVGHGNQYGINVGVDQVVRSETLTPHRSFLVGTVRPLLKGKAIRLFTCSGPGDKGSSIPINRCLAELLLVPVYSFQGALWWCHPVAVGGSLGRRGILSLTQSCTAPITNIGLVTPPVRYPTPSGRK